MPRNTKGGNKAKRGKNQQQSTELLLKDNTEDQQYAKVIKVLGNCRFELLSLDDNIKRIGHMRGKLRKRAWTSVDDIVLISLREFQGDKCDIIHKYKNEEVIKLRDMGEIVEKDNTEDNCAFSFDEI